MLSALRYIHANGIVHRDIKLENYVFSGPNPGEGAIKMIDFGLSRACLDSATMTQDVGSLVYKAPEISTGSYTEASDLWSFGMVCNMILTGIVPWEGNTRPEIEASIKRELSDIPGFHSFMMWLTTSSQVSGEAGSFLTGLLTPDPDLRLTCTTAREHPWLSGQQLSSHSPAMSRSSSAASLQVVRRLKEFRNNDALKRTVLLAMSFGVASAEMVALGERFKKLDADEDGLIGWEEFDKALQACGSTDTAENREIFEAINQDGTGKIKYSEFVASQLEADVYDANVQLEAAFTRLDINGTGLIGMEELKFLLQGPDTSEKDAHQEAAQVLTSMGKGEDGQMNAGEFKTAMRGVFSPESIEETETAEPIGQFKMMQLRLANELKFRAPVSATPEKKEVVEDDAKIGQFKLNKLLLASRLQFREQIAEQESTVGHFKLRSLMLASQLHTLEHPAQKAPNAYTRESKKLAPGSFRRRLLEQQTNSDGSLSERKISIRRRGTANPNLATTHN